MAVEKVDIGTRVFSRYYHRLSFVIVLIISAISGLLAGVAVLLTGESWQSPIFFVSILLAMSISAFASLMLIMVITKPLQDILSAISFKINEQTTTRPPNSNTSNYEQTGMKLVLDAIYKTDFIPDNTTKPITNPSALEQSLEHTGCGIIVLDPDMQIVYANKSAPVVENIDGVQQIALDFFGEQTILDWLQDIKNTKISAEKNWQRITTDRDLIKKQKIYDINVSFQKESPGETVIFLFDKSSKYIPEERDLDFIAFAAHELRGPITVIQGYLDILDVDLSERLSDDERQVLGRLIVSANRLSSYVNNILNVAKYDQHHLQVYLTEESIAGIFESISEDIRLRASTQHRLLNIDIPDNLPTVAADRGSIAEVFNNLIDNAIKYSFEGGVISITASAKGNFVEVSVTDNGIGMPSSVVKNLFKKFYRSHRSRETVAGTGIGLYICKAYIESHGGSISVRSRENEGSIFTFSLPIYDTVKDELLENNQLNNTLIKQKNDVWIDNHAMHRS